MKILKGDPTSLPVEKYVSRSIDAVALSTDMKTLYIYDAGKTVTFPLDTANGITISKSVESIVISKKTEDTVFIPPSLQAKAAPTPAPEPEPISEVFNVPSAALKTVQKQWTTVFHPKNSFLGIIGSTLIDGVLPTGETNPFEPKVLYFDLNQGVVNLKFDKNDLLIAFRKLIGK